MAVFFADVVYSVAVVVAVVVVVVVVAVVAVVAVVVVVVVVVECFEVIVTFFEEGFDHNWRYFVQTVE